MTPIDLDALDKQHQQQGERTDGGPEHCFACWLPWPCPTSTLIQVVRMQNEALRTIEALFVPPDTHPCPPTEKCMECAVYKLASNPLAEVAALVDLGEPT